MLSDEELEAALRGAAAAATEGIKPSARLTEYVLGLSVPEPPRRSAGRRLQVQSSVRRRLLAPAAILVAGLVAMIALGTSATPPSFAVTKGANGSISVTIRDLVGVSGANARLRELGTSILVVPIRAGCSSHVELTYLDSEQRSAATVKLTRGDVPAGQTILIAAESTGKGHVELAIGHVSGAVPECVAPEPNGYRLPTEGRRGASGYRDRERAGNG